MFANINGKIVTFLCRNLFLLHCSIPVKGDGVDCHVLQIEIGCVMCQEKCQQINNIFFFFFAGI